MRAIAVPMGGTRVLRGVRSWFRWRMACLALVALLLAMAQVWMRNRVRAEAYELSKVRQLQNDLLHREREARIQLEMERDSTTLRTRAMQHLGMVEPRAGQVVDVVIGAGTDLLSTVGP